MSDDPVSEPLVLAVDAEPIGRDGSGNETFLRGLITGARHALQPGERMVLCGPHVDVLEALAGDHPRLSVIKTPNGAIGQLVWASLAARHGANAALGNWNPPLGFRGRRGAVLHDAAIRAMPSTFPTPLRLRIEASMRLSARFCQLIVTPSEFSSVELQREFPLLSRRNVVVTSAAPGEHFDLNVAGARRAALRAREVLKLPPTFALALGSVQPRKNLRSAIEACRQAGIILCIAGRPIWGNKQPPDTDHVRWLGYVDDARLPGLYAAATALIYPSFYEGFGLPVIEAMAAGCPVICSSTTAVGEVAGTAAELVDPHSVEQVTLALKRVMLSSSHADELRARGRARAAEFTWERTADRVLAAFRATRSARVRPIRE